MKTNQEPEAGKTIRYLIIAAVVLILLSINYFHFTKRIASNNELVTDFSKKEDPMEKYRNPAVAGLFYPSSKQALDLEVTKYLQTDYKKHQTMPKIVIVPHAGYMYSAQAAAKAYLPLQHFDEEINTVILIGPSHHVAFNGAALPADDYFATPLGKIPVNKGIVNALSKKAGFSINDKAHSKEHSLEVQLPFLQKVLTNFTIVPIVYGQLNPQDLAETIQPYLKKKGVLLVVSADLSHYNNYDEAVEMDKSTSTKVLNQQADVDYHHSCGAGGINTALILSQNLHLKPQLLSLINSGDTAGDKQSVVGYGAWSFEDRQNLSVIEQEVKNLHEYTEIYGADLLNVARVSLEDAVLHGRTYKPLRKDYAEALFDKGAVFVTLNKNQELRGCIGTLTPFRAIALDIADNSYNAALKDPRFPPVTANELPQIKVSISILTDYDKMDFTSEEDLLSQIVAGVDGLVIRDGYRQGLFLPSVWELIPDKTEFLNNLKIKAGMSPAYWSNSIKVYRFRTVEIKENED